MSLTVNTTYRPWRWVGAPAPGGLGLPAAHPSPSTLYAPRGVLVQEDLLVAVDSGNHRIMIWHGIPSEDHASAQVVLGQPDFESEGPAKGGPERGLHLPTGVGVFEGRLYVADAWHHRVLWWSDIPQQNRPPDGVLGQADLSSVEVNRGGEVGPLTLYWPYAIAYSHGRFTVADTGNRRVLIWNGLPEHEQPPDEVLGQDDFKTNLENRGAEPSGKSFRWPHGVTQVGSRYLVADAGNHRVLGWEGELGRHKDADLVLGQADLTSNGEWPYGPQGGHRLRFPYAIESWGETLAVSDTANNRVLVWEDFSQKPSSAPAVQVLGQNDLDGNGENRWDSVQHDTLCWPYGIDLHENLLAVADSGNNRVMIWKR
jgi:NHL repeat-containing protein